MQEFTVTDDAAEIDNTPATREINVPELEDVDFKNVIGMPLSDAIRLGSKSLDKVNGWGDGISTGCALTAAQTALHKENYK